MGQERTQLTLGNARSALMRGGSAVFALRIGALVLAFGADLALTRTLGIEQYGFFSIGISLLSTLLIIGSLGINNAMLKVIPSELARDAPDRVRGMLEWSRRNMALSGVAVGAGLGGVVLLLGERIPGELRGVLLVLALFLPLQIVSLQRQSVLLALKRPVRALFPEQIIRWFVFLAMLGAAWLFRAELDATGATWMYGAGIVAGLVVSHRWQAQGVTEQVPRGGSAVAPVLLAGAWWSLALPLCWTTWMRVLNSRADPFMLGWLHEVEGAALYAVSNRLASLLLFGLMAVGAVVAPYISEQHAKGDRRELQALLTAAAKGLALYAIPLSLVLVIGGPWILALFGPDFGGAYPVLCLLVAGRTLTCLVGCVGYLLTMTGHEGRIAKIMTVCAAEKLLLNFVLIPIAGATGAAVATLIALTTTSVWLVVVVRRELGVDPTVLSLFRSQKWPTKGRQAA